jgi:predicted lipase
MVTTSPEQKFPDAYAEEQEPYWVEIQLVDEEGKNVANIPWRAENNATTSGHEKELKGNSDTNGLIRVEPRYGSELTLILDAQPLADEMEKRSLRVSRDPNESKVRKSVENDGYIWHYAVIGELCNKLPNIERREGEPYAPDYHFPTGKSLKGFKIKTNELERRHVIEICPFRAWELVLHHQSEYSLANALNLGAAASLAYADDNMFDTSSISRFFLNQCQDLSKLPQLYKGDYSTNALVKDIPFSKRYHPPVYIDSSKAADPGGDTQLFYVYSDDNVVVSWRGTASIWDGIADGSFRPVESESCDIKMQCTDLVSIGKVHYGFWDGYSIIEKKFSENLDELATQIKVKNLFICGHSLGGALALIHAAKLKDNAPILYTYGMPRTFTRDAVNQLSDITHYRHVNETDPIPALPPEANLDNWLYTLWGPLGTVLGGAWSTLELGAYQLKEWGDCFWHHGNTVAFIKTTQSKKWKECKVTLPYPQNCMTIRKQLPLSVTLYLVPTLAKESARISGEQQKEFKNSLTKEDLHEFFPKGTNPDRGTALNIFKHFMTSYMPYINNKLLGLIGQKKLIPCKLFNEHQEKIESFKSQMSENVTEIPENEFNRNNIFLSLEGLLIVSINQILNSENGDIILQRFALYGEEEME